MGYCSPPSDAEIDEVTIFTFELIVAASVAFTVTLVPAFTTTFGVSALSIVATAERPTLLVASTPPADPLTLV